MFRHLHIENFRGFKMADVCDLGRINIFFGKNNSGKSTLLEAAFILSGCSNPSLSLVLNKARGFEKIDKRSLSSIFYGYDLDATIQIKGIGEHTRKLDINVRPEDETLLDQETLQAKPLNNASFNYGLNFDFSFDNQPFHSILLLDEESHRAKVGHAKSYTERLSSRFIPSNFSQVEFIEVFANILKEKNESELLDILRIVEPRLKDIQIVGDEILLDVGLQERLPINAVGDGLRKVLSLVATLYACENGILFVDELDNGLHYSVMVPLWEALSKMAIKINAQIFATTHSLDLLRGLSTYLDRTSDADIQGLVSAYKVIRKPNDETAFVRYGYENLSYCLEQEMEIR